MQLAGSRASWNLSTAGEDAGPGPPCSRVESQLGPSRDGENIRRHKEGPIQDVMKEDQRPTEWEDRYSSNIIQKWLVVFSLCEIVFFLFFLSGEFYPTEKKSDVSGSVRSTKMNSCAQCAMQERSVCCRDVPYLAHIEQGPGPLHPEHPPQFIICLSTGDLVC